MPSNEAILRRITEEIWNQRRLDLIDELIAADFVDHVEVPGGPDGGRARYRASVDAMHRRSLITTSRSSSSSRTRIGRCRT